MAIVKQASHASALPTTAVEMTRGFMRNFWSRYRFIAPNIHTRNQYEMDICCIRQSGFVDEIEIKMSRSDFKADFKKTALIPGYYATKHKLIADGSLLPNYFSFLMPPALAEQCKDDIPDHAGLYIFRPELFYGSIYTEIKAPRLHGEKISKDLERHFVHKVAKRYVYQYAWEKENRK